MALLPVAAAVSPDAAPPSEMPVAITQPLGNLTAGLAQPGGAPLLPEPGMLVLVGSGLIGLAAVMRRTTRT